MIKLVYRSLLMLFLLSFFVAKGQRPGLYNSINSGTPWLDDRGKPVSAHGANIIKESDRYYLFGEKHSDTSNAFAGFTCYSSKDLYNWKFESIALPVQPAGKLGPNRVGERPKVMKCPKTGEYIMFMHADTLGYTDQFVGYATSQSVTGPYIFRGPLLFNGLPVKKWDMGTFQDSDGAGYVLLHGGDIYKLGDDYKSIVEKVNEAMTTGFESPAIFRKGNMYFFLGSNLTSWERNDNYYFTSASLKGPWIKRGLFCPPGTLTWNSQTTFVLPIVGSKDTTFMFMGDRWSYPKQESAATYVWQPLKVSDTSIAIPEFIDRWQINTRTGEYKALGPGKKLIENTDRKVLYSGIWKNSRDSVSLSSSDTKNDNASFRFNGGELALYGLSRPDGGYARVDLLKDDRQVLLSTTIDMYCKYPVSSLRFISPKLPKGNYTLKVSVTAERGNWSDKRKSQYGSTGYMVSLDKILVTP